MTERRLIRRCIPNQEVNELTMGSLFDGIGGFPLAAVRNGIRPVWASEIEALPIEVTKLRFPDMIHVGDITELNGADLPPRWISSPGAHPARIFLLPEQEPVWLALVPAYLWNKSE